MSVRDQTASSPSPAGDSTSSSSSVAEPQVTSLEQQMGSVTLDDLEALNILT
jgi:hypothetical protein